MDSSTEHNRAIQLSNELVSVIRGLSDTAVGEVLGHGVLDDLLKAILDPSEVTKYPNVAEFLLAHKKRSQLIALLDRAIRCNYAFKGTNEEGHTGFTSPSHIQYFEDGVMFMESDKPFEGYLGLYRNQTLSYAIMAKDVRSGEQVGPDHLDFVDISDFAKIQDRIPLNQIKVLEEPVLKLKNLLHRRINDESEYQELLRNYPWVLGAQYQKISRHENLDDANIPDFTGVRVHDGDRDIFELKPPFMKVFTKDGEFSAEFNRAWNQAERYLNFVRQEKDYLQRKGRRFDNPKCYLILGYDLTEQEIEQLRIKQRVSPWIQLFTYNDILIWMESTIKLVRQLKIQDEPNLSV